MAKLPENLPGNLGLFELGNVESRHSMLRRWISEFDIRVLLMSTEYGLNPTIVQYDISVF